MILNRKQVKKVKYMGKIKHWFREKLTEWWDDFAAWIGIGKAGSCPKPTPLSYEEYLGSEEIPDEAHRIVFGNNVDYQHLFDYLTDFNISIYGSINPELAAYTTWTEKGQLKIVIDISNSLKYELQPDSIEYREAKAWERFWVVYELGYLILNYNWFFGDNYIAVPLNDPAYQRYGANKQIIHATRHLDPTLQKHDFTALEWKHANDTYNFAVAFLIPIKKLAMVSTELFKLNPDAPYDYYRKTIANYFAVPQDIVDFRIDAISYYVDEDDRRKEEQEKADIAKRKQKSKTKK